MVRKGIFIDANLLVLLVVGATDQALISKHRRLRTFMVEDYGRLIELIRASDWSGILDTKHANRSL